MPLNFNKSQDQFTIYRQDGRCGNCGIDLKDEEVEAIHLHHVLNKKDGGAGVVENGVILCAKCHTHVHNYNTKQSIFVFRKAFKYANWDRNSQYKGRKKGKEVEFTKETLEKLDKIGEKMGNQNYESHLRMINELKQTLSVLQNRVQEIKEKYKQQIDAMESATFMDNYIKPLRNKYGAFSNLIEALNKMIDQHKQQISQHEESLEYLISSAKG